MLSFTHLVVFEAVLRTGSVTLAGEALDIPQPTVSRYLRQLRDHFSNPLFVRTSRGLEPTSQAQSAALAVSQVLELYRTQLSGTPSFEPTTATRTFNIAASDIGHLLILPPLLSWAREAAPDVRFSAVPLGGSKLISQLEAGEVDLAIGSFPALESGIMAQTLFRERYVCVVPRCLLPKGALTMAKFKSSRHVMVDGRYLGHIHEEVEKAVRKVVGTKSLSVTADSFLLSAHVAEQSQLILTSPSRLTSILDREKVRILPSPMSLPGFSVKQYWHERSHDDPGLIWLRNAIANMRKIWKEANPEDRE